MPDDLAVCAKTPKALTPSVNMSAVTTSIQRVDRGSRRQAEQAARTIRLGGIRDGLPPSEIVMRILTALPNVHLLEAHRWAQGWSRSELSAHIDRVYEDDGLHPPHVSDAELCRWEHGQRRPSDERVDYLCRVYGTRPDRLGFGHDYSGAMLGHLEQAGLSGAFPLTNADSKADLIDRLRGARERIVMFGLTRNFYGNDEMLPLFTSKSKEVPIRIFIMDPHCASRRDRYRLEPAEAAMEDPNRYVREVLNPLVQAVAREGTDLKVYLYDFPCSFAIEQIDDTMRVMLYGHGKRGTDGPILVFDKGEGDGTPYWQYFAEQLAWMQRLADADEIPEPWRSKDIRIREYS
ncbi:helix-turn-helix domain-containing protein [Kitasatospora sp. NBC_00085]|uniref:helix-turn-helix domain-containing protein n=1 Tax=unclassified Kitasatospora TaxID=2633591 RepID=UPI00324993E4